MEIIDVAEKLIGPVQPVGSHAEDLRRMANLGDMTDLVDGLINDVARVADYRRHYRGSMKQAGRQAQEFLCGLRESLPENEESE